MKFSGCLSIELCSQLPGVLRNKRRCSQKKRRLLLFPSVLMITCFRSALNDEPEKNAVHYVESSPATFSSAALRARGRFRFRIRDRLLSQLHSSLEQLAGTARWQC